MTIKEIRTLTGLTQKQFAEKYHITFSSIRNWESGHRTCPDYVAELLEFKVREDLKMDKTICKEYDVWLGGELYDKFKGDEKDKAIQCAKRISESPDYVGSVWINEVITNRIDWKSAVAY